MIQHDYPLTKLNTFGLRSVAERYLVLSDQAQLSGMEFTSTPALVLGGGSNLLLSEHVAGLTVQVALGGIKVLEEGGAAAGASVVEEEQSGGYSTKAEGSKEVQAAPGGERTPVRLRVGAGVDWNQLVRYTLDQGWVGLENLVLIPGTVGASPVQNIGAYGAEVAEFITAVHVWEYGAGARVLSPAECRFGYRDSYFKHEPDRYLITAVDLEINRPDHVLKTGYGAIQTELERLGRAEPTADDVALAVTNIRRSKLPDWFFLGNSGSFFKNPVVPVAVRDRIAVDHPDVPAYPIDAERVKLPAGWLIDRAGLRGVRSGKVGTYAHQALVIVNHGGAGGADVLRFSREVQAKVEEKFGVRLEREVRLVG